MRDEAITIQPSQQECNAIPPLEVIINRQVSGSLIICMPGVNEKFIGPDNKYHNIAQSLSTQHAVARVENTLHQPDYAESLRCQADAALEYLSKNRKSITGNSEAHIHLFGFSAGAGALATVAHKYEVKSMLLIAPSVTDAGEEHILDSLAKYTGRLHVAVGEWDKVTYVLSAQKAINAAVKADRELEIVKGGDHFFTGKYRKTFEELPYKFFSHSPTTQ